MTEEEKPQTDHDRPPPLQPIPLNLDFDGKTFAQAVREILKDLQREEKT
jgi:hypothetical protein